MQNLHKLQISQHLRDRFEEVLCEQIKDAVSACEDRDQMLQDYSNYVMGLTPIQTSARWNGASNLQLPFILKACMTIESQIIQQIRRDPKVTVAAIDPDDKDDAEAQEQFIVAKDHQCGLTSALAEVAKSCIKFPIGIMRVGWKDLWEWRRTMLYAPPDGGGLIPEDMLDPDVPDEEYDPQAVREKQQIYKGVELRNVPTYNWYTYPANATDLQTCLGTGEAMLMSEVDLLLGADPETLDLDRDVVDELLEHGPCSLRDADTKPLPDDERGVRGPSRQQDDMFEVFEWYCTAPIVRDEGGKIITPKYLWGEELKVVICPAAEKLLYLGYSEYQKPRPYVPFYIYPVENELYGRCAPEMLESLQTNADAAAQEFTNALQLATSPVFKVKKSAEPLNENAQFFPGAVFFYDKDPNEILPMEVIQPDPENMQVIEYYDTQMQAIYAAAGWGQQTGKVLKAAQINQQQQQATQRLDIFSFYFSGAGREGTGTTEVVRRIVALCSEHMDSEGEEYLDDADHKKKITPNQLKGKFMYRATGSGNSADPDTKTQHAEMASALAEKWWTLVAQLGARPDILNHMWAAYRQVLQSIEIHNIEELIGDQPQIPSGPEPGQQAGGQPQPMLPQMVGAGGQQANGNNGATPGGMQGMANAQ